MASREKIVCECGGELTRPIPAQCPHCGATISGVRMAWWPLILPLLLILLMFGGLVAFLYWWVGGQLP